MSNNGQKTAETDNSIAARRLADGFTNYDYVALEPCGCVHAVCAIPMQLGTRQKRFLAGEAQTFVADQTKKGRKVVIWSSDLVKNNSWACDLHRKNT